jgi:hypothetical protein
MNLREKMAAISFSEFGASERASYQAALSLLEMADELGGIDALRGKLDSVIAVGVETKAFKKWAKGQEEKS